MRVLRRAPTLASQGERTWAESRMRVLALDYGSARCGCALSDPTGTIVTPIEAVPRPATQARARALCASSCASARWSAWSSGCRCRSTARTPSRRARRARSRAQLSLRLGEGVPVEMHDERFTTRIAQRMDGRVLSASEDSRAAAHLLESWLAARSR